MVCQPQLLLVVVLPATAIASGGVTVKFEKYKASGTDLGTITFSSGDAVGQVREVVLTTTDGADDGRVFAAGDHINIEVDGGGGASSGAVNVWMYFEAL
jgi:hypothetical protein